ncbi:alpha/beta hydrolase [Shewanella sp. KT0246]|uniref:alpha/beta hydrolase n=1 Tax=Shewanella sp. KT0246 TaxID=2815912 RepID=UPI001BBB779F|nr:alpha/beta fold hydrolase [Shewanella sp. KT0246]GIU50412.1 esterase [Shewanella sp. KT0246]
MAFKLNKNNGSTSFIKVTTPLLVTVVLSFLSYSAAAVNIESKTGAAPESSQKSLPTVSQGTLQRLDEKYIEFTLIKPRPIDVWLPEDYPANAPYAVVYMHDGKVLFDASKSWNGTAWEVDETAATLNKIEDIKPFIVVGIHNAEQSRHSEYFPQKPFESLSEDKQTSLYQTQRNETEKLLAQAVYSDKYAEFIVTELKPYIDTHFKVATDKQNTFIMGSSMGGLISWYTALEYPQVFGGAACLSTHWPGSFAQDNNPIPQVFNQYLAKQIATKPQVKLYFDYGDQTLDAMYPPLQADVDKLFEAAEYDKELWQSHFFKGKAHNENDWAERLSIPMTFLLTK